MGSIPKCKFHTLFFGGKPIYQTIGTGLEPAIKKPKDAKRNIPKGIVAGVFVVIGIYLLVNITYLSLMSIPQLIQVHESGNQIAAVEAVRSF